MITAAGWWCALATVAAVAWGLFHRALRKDRVGGGDFYYDD